jgi:probable rRNA maturation factor
MTAMSDPAIGRSGLLVEVQFACDTEAVPDEHALADWAQAAYDTIRRVPAELVIRIVGSEEMRVLNHEYRGADKPTNVLSFALGPSPKPGDALLGDIVICREVVLGEAREQDKDSFGHWAHMTVHGVLHLCGYDHEIESDAADMEALEGEILVKLGFRTPW